MDGERGLRLVELLHPFAETRAGAYEVVGVEPGHGVSLLDQGSGDRLEVTDVSLSRNLTEGDLVLAWIAMGLDGREPMAGVVPIPPRARASLLLLLDGGSDAATLAAWYDALHAPPRLTDAAGAGPDHDAGSDPGDVDL